MDALETYRLQKQKMTEDLKAFGQDLFKPFFEKLFLDHPDAQRVRWTQYTPHFNDGDPCVFNVHEAQVSKLSDAEDLTGDEDNWYESWTVKEEPSLASCAQAVGKFFNGIEDCLEAAFGDGVQVIVERSGAITIDDYNHD